MVNNKFLCGYWKRLAGHRKKSAYVGHFCVVMDNIVSLCLFNACCSLMARCPLLFRRYSRVLDQGNRRRGKIHIPPQIRLSSHPRRKRLNKDALLYQGLKLGCTATSGTGKLTIRYNISYNSLNIFFLVL